MENISDYIEILGDLNHPNHEQTISHCMDLLKSSDMDPFSHLDYHILLCMTYNNMEDYLGKCRSFKCPKHLSDPYIGIYLFYHPQDKCNRVFRLSPSIRVNKFCQYIVDHGTSSDSRCPLSIEQVFTENTDISVHHCQVLINYLNSKTLIDCLISSLKHFSKAI